MAAVSRSMVYVGRQWTADEIAELRDRMED